MLHPSGFSQHSVTTSLGPLAYYTADTVPWLLSDKFFLDRRLPDKREQPAHRPFLVFLHGFGGGSSAYEWSKVYPAFATDYQVVAPDLIGWGRSTHLGRYYQIEDYLTTIREFLEQVCGQATTVIASSLTAALTMRVAIDHPHLFKSLILVAPSGLSDFGKDFNRSPFAQLARVPLLDQLIYTNAIATAVGIRNFLEQRQFARANRVSQEMVDAYLASAQQRDAAYSALSFVRGDLCFDLGQYITQLTVPTAIVWGKLAQFTKPDIGIQLADLNPRAIKILHFVDDVGLTPQLELPAVTIGLFRQILQVL